MGDHIIAKQSIDLDFKGEQERQDLPLRIRNIFMERLKPAMEQLFDEMADEKHTVSIDRLEIDCGEIDSKDWEQKWVDKTRQLLKEQLLVADRRLTTLSPLQNWFFYFLRNGHLPWNAKTITIDDLEQQLRIDEDFLSKLIEVLNSAPSSAERLAFQFSQTFGEKLTRALIGKDVEIQVVIDELMDKPAVSASARARMKAAVIKALAAFRKDDHAKSNDSFKTKLETAISAMAPGNVSKREPPIATDPVAGDAVYIANSGLVLLHPFLPALFKELGLVEEGEFINGDARQMAVACLGFIASGDDDLPEFELPLCKLLCGLPVEEAVVQPQALPEKIKEECDHLLGEAIKHWSALKNTGIETFRSTFIRRNGKLSKVDKGWQLQVEQNTVDVLLNSLPWGIGVIKLPWMQHILFTEWA